MKKKILSLMLALVMCLGLIPTTVFAFSDFEIENGVLTKYYSTYYNGYAAIPDGVTSIAPKVFKDTTHDLTGVSIPNSVTTIGAEAFYNCQQLASLTIPNSVTTIGESAFYGCIKVTSLTIPSSVTSIGKQAFDWCAGLTSLTIEPGVTGIGLGAFTNCYGLTSVTIPGSVISIEPAVFCNCYNLTSVTVLDGVTSIEMAAFDGCESLTSVTLPASVTSIGYAAFNGCESLTDVYYNGSEAQWKAISIDNTKSDIAEDGNSYLLNANIHYNSGANTQPTTPTQPAKSETASPTNDKLEVNGAAANPTVYKIGGSNYFKIRDVAALLNGTEKQFAVGYDGTKNAVTATTGQGYAKLDGDLAGAATGGDQSAAASNDAVYVNGEKITAEVYKIGGSNYFKLRDLGKALNFYVGWSAERGMYIETDKPYSE